MATNKLGPLVPVRVERLRAALRIRKKPVLQVAEQSGVRQQTINYIVRDDSGKRRCREAHLRAIARALDVGFDYLTGEIDRLRFARTSYEYDEDGFRIPVDTSDPEQLAGIHLAEDHFGRRCYAAIVRDLIRSHGTRQKAEEAYLNDEWWQLLEGLLQMIRPGTWQAAVLKAPGEPVRPQRRGAPVMKREHEGLDALAKGFEVVLAPWLDGRAQLDVEALGVLRRAMTDGSQKNRPHRKIRRGRSVLFPYGQLLVKLDTLKKKATKPKKRTPRRQRPKK